MARFSFADLCAKPLGASDYLRLCELYHTVFIEGIPRFERSMRNEAKRFIILIDTFYDNHLRIIALAEASQFELGGLLNGTEAFEFDRTASRLTEMQSDEYLDKCLGL